MTDGKPQEELIVHDLRTRQVISTQPIPTKPKSQTSALNAQHIDAETSIAHDATSDLTAALQKQLRIDTSEISTTQATIDTDTDTDDDSADDTFRSLPHNTAIHRPPPPDQSTPIPSAPNADWATFPEYIAQTEHAPPPLIQKSPQPRIIDHHALSLYPNLHSAQEDSSNSARIEAKPAPAFKSDSDSVIPKQRLDSTDYKVLSTKHKKERNIHEPAPEYHLTFADKMYHPGCHDLAGMPPPMPPAQPGCHIPIADSIISPKAFSGTTSENAEEWCDYLEKYFAFRNLHEQDKIRLFNMLLRGGAGEWMSTLPPETLHSYDALKNAFCDAYYPSPELRWTEASAIWQHPQAPNERVDDFVTRLKRGARRVQISEDMLHLAVLNGLRPNIRCQVLQQGAKDLNQTVRLARIAETTLSTDPVTALLVENMKVTSQIAEKQSQELKELTSKVSALSATTTLSQLAQKAEATTVAAAMGAAANMQQTRYFSDRADTRDNETRRPATYRFTRQQQRGGATGDRRFNNNDQRYQRTGMSRPIIDCSRCGYKHPSGNCPAYRQECRNCGGQGHFARRCRGNQRVTRA